VPTGTSAVLALPVQPPRRLGPGTHAAATAVTGALA
jgi:hypothetical protein